MIYRFRRDSEKPQHLVCATRTSTTTRTATNLRFNLVDQNEISTLVSKYPSRHWKTVDWKTSGQLKTLEKEQAHLLELFARHLTELEGYLTQNKTMNVESAYRGFFETTRSQQKAAKVNIETKLFRSFWQWHQSYVRRKEQSFEMGNWQSTISQRHRKFPRRICQFLEREILSKLTILEKKLKTKKHCVISWNGQ